jgi:acyl-CoA oxidase
VDDILEIGPKFWEFHLDPIFLHDIGAFTILTAHTNLAVGTIARYIKDRPDIRSLVASLLRLDIVGVYLLSERGHGLDVFNLETTATKTNSGFVLNTPREEAMKCVFYHSAFLACVEHRPRLMSATTPLFGIRKIAVVMARLVVEGVDHGHRWFIVPICDEFKMHPGVVSRRLPARTGTSPLDFSLTSFSNVFLPHTALLGPLDLSSKTSPSREAWWSEVWRLTHGSMAVAAPVVQALKHAAYIGGKYSSHRHILGKDLSPIPLITIPTQQWPIIQGIALSFVLEAWYRRCAASITSRQFNHEVLHGISVTVKATVFRYFQQCSDTIAERCGAQGTFEWNEMARLSVCGRSPV